MRKLINSIEDLKGARVTVMGLGEHGGAVGNINWLQQKGAKLIVTDLKKADELANGLVQIKNRRDIELVLGEHREQDFIMSDLVIRNPAVPRQASYLELARAKGVAVEMDSSLFFKWFDRKKIIGVTGSKGKSTTATVMGGILGLNVIGLEGTSPLATLDELGREDWVVFELSSWRLEALDEQKLSPGMAVVTSIYRDHLNTYRSFDEYINVKKAIFRYQDSGDLVILNWDDSRLRQWSKEISQQVYGYALRDYGVAGIYIDQDQVMVRENRQEKNILAMNILPARFEHERRNLLPAIFLAAQRGMTNEQIVNKVRQAKPLAHRMESVAEIHGVEYINDSSATMPDATIAALKALGDKSIVHILGGNDKNLEFSDWAKEEAGTGVKHLIWLPGNASKKMADAYKEAGGKEEGIMVADMSQAVEQAASLAVTGDVVLLSPGATSFGSFKHEFDRGNKFKEAVMELTAENPDGKA